MASRGTIIDLPRLTALIVLVILLLSVISCTQPETSPTIEEPTEASSDALINQTPDQQSTVEEEPANLSETSPTPNIITVDASELALQIQDLSSGWIVANQGSESTGQYRVQFGTMYGSSIVNRVSVYETIEQAEDSYLSEKQKINQTYFISALDFGDESFWYMLGPTSEIYFRKNNVVVWLQYYPQLGNTPDSEILDAAEVVEANIFKAITGN